MPQLAHCGIGPRESVRPQLTQCGRCRPSAAIVNSRTLRSTPENGAGTGHDGAKRKKGSESRLALSTLGHFLAQHVTLASDDDRPPVGRMVEAILAATDESVDRLRRRLHKGKSRHCGR